MSRSVAAGLREAFHNALKVLWGGLVAFGLYVGFVVFGPAVEGYFLPVITDYELANIRTVQGGGFAFRPTFVKARDCDYYGVTWFAQDERGGLTRIQLGRQSDQGPPVTGPVGQRVGERVTLFPPQGTKSIWGLNHHECGMPWQIRTMVGPFMLQDGKPSKVPVPVRYALRRGQ